MDRLYIYILLQGPYRSRYVRRCTGTCIRELDNTGNSRNERYFIVKNGIAGFWRFVSDRVQQDSLSAISPLSFYFKSRCYLFKLSAWTNLTSLEVYSLSNIELDNRGWKLGHESVSHAPEYKNKSINLAIVFILYFLSSLVEEAEWFALANLVELVINGFITKLNVVRSNWKLCG